MVSIIVAMDQNGLIGSNNSKNGIPWSNKEDLQHFKETTVGQTILMGRTTYEKIGKPLPNRKTIVLSSMTMDDPRVEVCHNLEELLEKYKTSKDTLYICGGSSVYKQAMEYANELIISTIPGEYNGNSYFPTELMSNFELVYFKKMKTFILEKYARVKQ